MCPLNFFVYLHDSNLCNDCWKVVDLSTNFCYLKFNYRMLSWVGIFCCCCAVFLEQPVMFNFYLWSGTSKNSEIFVEETRLMYHSFATGTTSKPARIWEISLLQSGTIAQTRTQNRLTLPLFLIKIMSESVKVVWTKVVTNFISFPNMYGTPLLDLRNSSYELNTALLILHLVQKKFSKAYLIL
mgnify:CR=1 FL=1